MGRRQNHRAGTCGDDGNTNFHSVTCGQPRDGMSRRIAERRQATQCARPTSFPNVKCAGGCARTAPLVSLFLQTGPRPLGREPAGVGQGRAPHVPGSADPGTKIAAVERREALPAQRQRRRHASPGCRAASPAAPGSSQAPTFFDAPLPSLGRDVWTTAYPVPVTNAGDGACPFHPPARGQGIRKKQGCPLPLRHRMIGLDLPFQPTTPKNKRSTETRL